MNIHSTMDDRATISLIAHSKKWTMRLAALAATGGKQTDQNGTTLVSERGDALRCGRGAEMGARIRP